MIKTSNQSKLNDHHVQYLIKSPEVYATILLIASVDKFSTECFDWDPEVLYEELEKEYTIKLPRINKDKLQAIIISITNNYFYKDLQSFIIICQALNNISPDFIHLTPLGSDDILWAVYEVFINDEPEKSLSELFDENIKRFIGYTLLKEGIYELPHLLKYAIYPENMIKEKIENIMDPNDPEWNKTLLGIAKGKYKTLMKDFLFNKQNLEQQLQYIFK